MDKITASVSFISSWIDTVSFHLVSLLSFESDSLLSTTAAPRSWTSLHLHCSPCNYRSHRARYLGLTFNTQHMHYNNYSTVLPVSKEFNHFNQSRFYSSQTSCNRRWLRIKSELAPHQQPENPSTAALAYEGLLGPLRNHQSPIKTYLSPEMDHSDHPTASPKPTTLSHLLKTSSDLQVILKAISAIEFDNVNTLNSLAFMLTDNVKYNPTLRDHWSTVCLEVIQCAAPLMHLSVHHVVSTICRLLDTPLQSESSMLIIENDAQNQIDSIQQGIYSKCLVPFVIVLTKRTDTPLGLLMQVLRTIVLDKGIQPSDDLIQPLDVFYTRRLSAYHDDASQLLQTKRIYNEFKAKRANSAQSTHDTLSSVSSRRYDPRSQVYDLVTYGFIMTKDLDSAVRMLNLLMTQSAYPLSNDWIVHRIMRVLFWSRCLLSALAILYAFFLPATIDSTGAPDYFGIPADLNGPRSRIRDINIRPIQALPDRRLALSHDTVMVVIGGLSMNTYADVALKILSSDQVKAMGIHGHVGIYTSIAHGALLGYNPMVDVASECMRRMGVTLNGETLSTTLPASSIKEHTEPVMKPDLAVWTVLFHLAIRSGDDELAQRVLTTVLNSGIKMDARFLQHLAHWYLLHGHYQEYMNLLQDHIHDQPTYLVLVKTLLRVYTQKPNWKAGYSSSSTETVAKRHFVGHVDYKPTVSNMVHKVIQHISKDVLSSEFDSYGSYTTLILAVAKARVEEAIECGKGMDVAEQWVMDFLHRLGVGMDRTTLMVFVSGYLKLDDGMERGMEWFGFMIGWDFENNCMRDQPRWVWCLDFDGTEKCIHWMPIYLPSAMDMRLVITDLIRSKSTKPLLVFRVIQAIQAVQQSNSNLKKDGYTHSRSTSWYTDDRGVMDMFIVQRVCEYLDVNGMQKEVFQVMEMTGSTKTNE
ncbi:hypothetical protein MT418_003621 [Batrachochytrium dendrobatidis]